LLLARPERLKSSNEKSLGPRFRGDERDLPKSFFVLFQRGAEPQAPSCKAIYGWLPRRPEFRAMYAPAGPATRPAAKRQMAWLEGRIGRLRPRTDR